MFTMISNKRVTQKLPSRPSLPRILDETLSQKVSPFLRQLPGNLRDLLVPGYTLEQRPDSRGRGVIPGRLPSGHLGHHAPQRPDIARRLVLVRFHRLRCNVQRSASQLKLGRLGVLLL